MAKERDIKYYEKQVAKLDKKGKLEKLIDGYEGINWATMIGALLLIGGSIGLAIASIDALQIAIIRYYKKKKKGG